MMYFKPASFLALVIVAFAGLSAVSATPSPRPQDCGEQQDRKRTDHVENCWL
ncbi:hypothetical protein FKP32DRAFT_1671783 [Trametes sanguinea]|nr:hypothetical protein FKP32DRAFT_1671783 [Trametes sanguinea]